MYETDFIFFLFFLVFPSIKKKKSSKTGNRREHMLIKLPKGIFKNFLLTFGMYEQGKIFLSQNRRSPNADIGCCFFIFYFLCLGEFGSNIVHIHKKRILVMWYQLNPSGTLPNHPTAFQKCVCELNNLVPRPSFLFDY